MMVDDATASSAALRIANVVRFKLKWSKNDRRTLKWYLGHFGPDWPTTFVATATKMGNNGTINFSELIRVPT